MLPLCRETGVGVIPWSPLARGFLAGNRTRDSREPTARAKSDEYARNMYFRDADFAIVERVGELAAQKGVSSAQIALAWLLHQPGVTAPIVGATKIHHLEEAVAAVDVVLLDEEQFYLTENYQPHPILGHS